MDELIARWREEMRDRSLHAYWVARRWLVEAGRRLVEQGALAAAGDVFSLRATRSNACPRRPGPLLEEALRRGFTRGVGAPAKEGPTIYSKTGAPSREDTLYERSL